jgi:hypothetical protein
MKTYRGRTMSTSVDEQVGNHSQQTPAPSTTVQAALDAYLLANGFSVEAYHAPTFQLTILGRVREFPNSPQRQWAIPLHDLHHVATGYGTDFAGEAEIGAWELGAGCRTPIVYLLNIIAVAFGMVLSPVRVWRAFGHGLRARTLYRMAIDRSACLALDLLTFRHMLRVPVAGLGASRWKKVNHTPDKPYGLSRDVSA